MTDSTKSTSLFDDIFKLQNTAPEADIDPEDPEDGFKASLIEDKIISPEILGGSVLRRKAAIIPDDPKYRGKKTSRQDLYLEGQDEEGSPTESSQNDDSDSMESDVDVKENEDKNNDDDEDDDDVEYKTEVNIEPARDRRADTIMHLKGDDDTDREKGKALMFQLGLWDDLIKSRIALQKLVTDCNRLPQPSIWPQFVQQQTYRQEAMNVHSSVKKLVSSLLELQHQLQNESNKPGQQHAGGADSEEEITSSSEEEQEEGMEVEKRSEVEEVIADDDDETEDDDEVAESRMDGEDDNNLHSRGREKRKLRDDELEETLAKRHKQFQQYRNDTLSMWDEKTRLAAGKIKAKNFAAFEVSVLKQIEQILVNKERLIRRLHQQRTPYKILGNVSGNSDSPVDKEDVIDDDDDDVELQHKIQDKNKQEVTVQEEIIDDNDFYHVCLRDLIMLRQNEETDPVSSNRQWLEIQRLRNKQKRRVDTRASKGRKIRYNVKEKLKNYMTPYDKSQWSDEQKDDLFKALFGGTGGQQGTPRRREELTIRIGL